MRKIPPNLFESVEVAFLFKGNVRSFRLMITFVVINMVNDASISTAEYLLRHIIIIERLRYL